LHAPASSPHRPLGAAEEPRLARNSSDYNGFKTAEQ
jgi:hypothetical protein